MKVYANEKYNKIVGGKYLEVYTKYKGKIINERYVGFTEKNAIEYFKKDFKSKLKHHKEFRYDVLNKNSRYKNFVRLGDYFLD